MLVLSRRENEQILFPALGISVEVLRTNPKNVRLGITAPREIRVVRGELAEFASDAAGKTGISHFCRTTVRRELEAASLAIRLAQNQLQQGLDGQAEETLNQAMYCLQNLEDSLALDGDQSVGHECVRESRSGYQLKTKSASNNKHLLANIVAECLIFELNA